MAFLVLGANSVSGYTVKNSARFNSGSSDYLSKTLASDGNRKTFTISFWLKKTSVPSSAYYWIAGSGTTTSDSALIYFDNDNNHRLSFFNSSGDILRTSMSFRDVSAWYHIVIAVDTTQATASNRVKLYVNGVQQTSFVIESYPTQNTDLNFNKAQVFDIGRDSRTTGGTGTYINGYLSEIYFIDGQQKQASDFGETDTDTGIWIPKAYTGTYGTNGFYLKFANSASLGTDSSGNGNTFTVNNLTSIDQSTDTPSNNFATGNNLLKIQSTITVSNGNLTATESGTDWGSLISTIGANKGKWYAEIKWQSGTYFISGITSENALMDTAGTAGFFGKFNYGVGYKEDGLYRKNGGSWISYGNTLSSGDIVGIALDLDNNYVYFSKNGTWQNSGVPTSGSSGTGGISITATSTAGNYFIGGSPNTSTVDLNFGNPPYSANSYTDGAGYGNFSYSVPSGYYALCTKNLAQYG